MYCKTRRNQLDSPNQYLRKIILSYWLKQCKLVFIIYCIYVSVIKSCFFYIIYHFVWFFLFCFLLCKSHCKIGSAWWHRQMETFSALLALCDGNSPVAGEFHAQRPVTRSFDVFFDLRLNQPLSKQSWGWWSETPPSPLWRLCNVLLRRTAVTLIELSFISIYNAVALDISITICIMITWYERLCINSSEFRLFIREIVQTSQQRNIIALPALCEGNQQLDSYHRRTLP